MRSSKTNFQSQQYGCCIISVNFLEAKIMFKKIRLIAVIAIIAMICGCAHTQLTRRYQYRWPDGSIPTPEAPPVMVSAFTMDTPAGKAKSILMELSPRGQAAFIEQVGKMSNQKLDDFISAMASTHETPVGTIDKTVFHKRVVFAVAKQNEDFYLSSGEPCRWSPADRIGELEITLEDPSDSAIFASWDKFDTVYDSVNLGSLGRTQTVSGTLTATVSPTFGPPGQETPASLQAQLSQQKSINEQLVLQHRYIKLSGAISPDKKTAIMRQEGAVGIDLTGTFSVDFLIKINPESTSLHSTKVVASIGPLQKNGAWLKPEQVQLNFVTLKYLYPLKIPITSTLDYSYTIRKVERNDREVAEGLQTVRFINGHTVGQPVQLVSKDELRVTLYRIAAPGAKNWLRYLPAGTTKAPTLDFYHYGDAKKVLTWLRGGKYTFIGRFPLSLHTGKLNRKDIPRLFLTTVTINED
jgi:hypothetical protein